MKGQETLTLTVKEPEMKWVWVKNPTSTVTDPEVVVVALGRPVSGTICLLLGIRRSSSIITAAWPRKSSVYGIHIGGNSMQSSKPGLKGQDPQL